MNIPKKVKAIFLTFVMLLSMGLNGLAVSAAEPLNPEATGSITIHKLEEPDPELEINLPNDGTQITQAQLDALTEAQRAGLKPIEGIVFTITEVILDENGDLEDPTTGFTYSKTNNVVTTDPTGSDGITSSGELPQGIYYVEEVGNDITFGRTPFFVSIPMTNPAGDGYIYNVHVYPKNEVGTFTKELVPPIAGSNIVTWKITSSIPHDIKDGTSFTITDELDERLQYVPGSIKIYHDSVGTANLIDTAWYTHVYSTVGYPGGTLTIELLPGTDNANFKTLANYSNLIITFETMIVLEQNDDDADFDTIYNSAELEYENSVGEKFNKETPTDPTDPEIPKVDPFGIRIVKIDNSSAAVPLEDATFKIYTSATDAANKQNALQNPKTGNTDWVVETDEDGYGYFYGLVAGKYWLVETAAPDGYNPLTAPIEIEIVKGAANVVDSVYEVTVINNPDFTLPITGGAGTLLFTLIGLLLIGAAIVVYTISKKRKEQQA